ncbi:MAG: hypothetical protein M3336_08285, partial [Chloroflexota bacterium]|nr:hypothetical protein [Chloroflexota bacterium]
MSVLTRRRFMLLSTCALLSACACSPVEPHTGLRGSGTVLRPRETWPLAGSSGEREHPPPTAVATPPVARPSLEPEPTPP